MELIKLDIMTSSKIALQMKMFEENIQTYKFKKNNLITSKEKNSKGKTTLVRFILYALGYEIPLTDGMDFYNYKTEISLKIKEEFVVLVREKKTLYLKDKQKKIKLELGKAVNVLLGITEDLLIDNILGSLYIDQEKGWTLLNRGKIIGNRKFNMLEFLVGINSLTNLKDELEEIKESKKNIKELNVLEEVGKYNKVFSQNSIELNSIIEEKEELEKEKKALELKINSLQRRTQKLKNIMKDNEDISEQIENLNLVIRHNGEEFLVTKDNIVGNNLEKKMLNYQITGNEIQIEEQKSLLKKYNLKLEKYNYNGLNIKSIFNKIEELDLPWKNISDLKKIKSKQKNNTVKKIKKEANLAIKEYWKILKPILSDLKVSKEYLKEDIILTDKLRGKSGTQLHKLTFAFKLACLTIIKEKLGVTLPIIIDSPRSGEVGIDESKLMLSVLKKNLGLNQIVIVSIYEDYDIAFDNIINLENGVVNGIEKFIEKE